MTLYYRKGLVEFREAVRKALNAGSSDKDIKDGRWWIYGEGRNPVATEAAIDAVIHQCAKVIENDLRRGGLIRLRGFGTFYMGKRLPRPMTGACSGVSLARKVVRFKPCKALRVKVMASPEDVG